MRSARAAQRAGELLKEIEKGHGKNHGEKGEEPPLSPTKSLLGDLRPLVENKREAYPLWSPASNHPLPACRLRVGGGRERGHSDTLIKTSEVGAEETGIRV